MNSKAWITAALRCLFQTWVAQGKLRAVYLQSLFELHHSVFQRGEVENHRHGTLMLKSDRSRLSAMSSSSLGEFSLTRLVGGNGLVLQRGCLLGEL